MDATLLLYAVYGIKFIGGSHYINWLPSSVDLLLNKTECR